MTAVVFGLLLVLVIGVIGYADWVIGVGERDALVERTLLDVVEERHASLANRLDRRLRRTDWGQRLNTRLRRAGSPRRVVDVVFVVGVGMAITFLLTSRLLSWWFALALSLGVIYLARAYLNRLENRRREQFAAQLADVARVLSNATSAGLALRSAIRMASDDVAEPAASELRTLSDELDVGTPLNDALTNLHERLPSRELSLLTRTLIIQARAGGAVVTALRGMSETLESRKDLRREIRTMLSGATFTGWVVLILAVGALIMINGITPGTLHKMTTSPVGQIGIVIAGVVYAFGFVLIRRTTKIEV